MRKETELAEVERNLPDLRATFANIAGNKRGYKSIVFAKAAQICAKFTAPFVTVPSVLVRLPEGPREQRRGDDQNRGGVKRGAAGTARGRGPHLS